MKNNITILKTVRNVEISNLTLSYSKFDFNLANNIDIINSKFTYGFN